MGLVLLLILLYFLLLALPYLLAILYFPILVFRYTWWAYPIAFLIYCYFSDGVDFICYDILIFIAYLSAYRGYRRDHPTEVSRF